MEPEIITDATVEPVSLELAWAQCSLDAEGSPPSTPFDALFEQVWIPASRQLCEDFTGLVLAPKTLRVSLDEFPDGAIELATSPVTAIESITYVDSDGEEQTIDAAEYTLSYVKGVWWVVSASGWPTAGSYADAVRVTFEAGYTSENIQAIFKQAILLTVAEFFRNREATSEKPMHELPHGVRDLLRPRRVRLGMA